MSEHHQQEYWTASYQGERLGLRLNWQAIADLRGVLDGLSPGSPGRSSGRVRVRLPDGRDLTLTVAATDARCGMSTASGSATTGWRTATSPATWAAITTPRR